MKLLTEGKVILSQNEPAEDQPAQHQQAQPQPAEDQLYALNLVKGWNANSASSLVATPIVFSLTVSIIWPIVAVTRYGMDIQISVQTGFTV